VDSKPDADIQIAGYRIEARVGRGGMGEVYRAVQLDLGRRVALKVLAPELAADDRFRRRFLRESRIAASIDHPSIIPIYQTGEAGGLLYIAMRYVDGPDLATVLRREGRLEPARALAIMAQVASALDAAHEHGLVHRDVKPANILLAAGRSGSDGHCYLCDFGLIKQVDSEQAASALTATDQFVGTIPYVAPEQIEGRAIDGRTDVYSLGCVLFHCLTGSIPFDGSSDVEVIFAHLGKPPPPLSTRAPGLPADLDPIVARALAKSKEDRWPTCSALVAALTTHLPSPTLDAPTRSMPRPAPATGIGSGSPAAAAGSGTPAPPATGSGPPVPAAGGGSPAPAVGSGSPEADAGGGTQILEPAGEATEIVGPADPGAGSPGPPVPPLARPAGGPASTGPAPGPPGRPASARPVPGPPAREGNRPAGGVPGAVHRGGPSQARVHDGRRRRGRLRLTVLAAVVLPVVAYVAAVQVLGGDDEPRLAGAPTTVTATVATTARPPTTAAAACRWSRPEVGTQARSAPLAAIRAHMGWSDRFVVDEMRAWTASDGNWRWYVKAHQEQHPSRRGRWLVGQQEDGQRLVLASAGFTTKGYAARDWRLADGQQDQLAAVAGCLAGT
jgi:serine/threonine-protein kinase